MNSNRDCFRWCVYAGQACRMLCSWRDVLFCPKQKGSSFREVWTVGHLPVLMLSLKQGWSSGGKLSAVEQGREVPWSCEMQFHCFAWPVPWKQGTSDFELLCLSILQKQKYFWITYIKIKMSSHVPSCVSVVGTRSPLHRASILAVTRVPASWVRTCCGSVAMYSMPTGAVCPRFSMWLGRVVTLDIPRAES